MGKRALITAAHADDETLGCGGTVLRLVDEGWQVELITFTDGGRAVTRQADMACHQLGIQKYTALPQVRRPWVQLMPDNAMDSVPLLEVVRQIEAYTKPPYDLILTHWPDCLNVDHGIVARATITAFRAQDGYPHKMLAYYVPSSSEWHAGKTFSGNVYYGLTSAQADRKVRALECYREEMRDPPHPRSYSNVSLLLRVWGAEVGLKWAEKFMLLREVL
jgi:LmbE family N-acetylglucosaminyl deacetylase